MAIVSLSRILLLSSIFILLSSRAAATIRVAVIDTGVGKEVTQPCHSGHKDFTGTGLIDTNGHGSNISGIIDRYALGADYCQIYLKYYGDPVPKDIISLEVQAFKEAIRLKVDIINFSSTGKGTSPAEEREVVKEALDAGITVVTAAGNEHSDLDSKCDFFPACIDSRVVSVGCSDCVQSNTGKVIKIWEHGKAITAGGYTMTGTSQATAVFTGKLVKIMHDRAKKRSK